MNEMENVIFGTAFNYKVEQIAPFVESWRKFTPNTRLMMLIEPDCNQEKIDYLLSNDVDIKFFSAAYFIPSAIHNTRYFKYLDTLLEYRGYFDRVFLTDVRDVVFQGDIFAEITKPGLHCFMEDPAWTCDERFNKHILTTNYGEQVAREFADKRIICSGTTLGGAEEILQYIVALMNQRDLKKMMEVGGIPDEQACHNYIFHRDLLPHTKQENGDGVATICLTHPREIKILGDGRISVYGKTPAVIHQWDRHPNLVEYYTKLYVKKE